MVYLFLADGFEEIEALTTLDLLRRCEINVITVGIGSQNVTGAHDITVTADTIDNMIVLNNDVDAVVLPGGMPGTLNEEKSECVQKAIDFAASNNKLLCAICAAPSILGKKGLLKNKKATCYPGYEEQLFGAEVTQSAVEVDGNVITAKGAGCSIDFSLKIAEKLVGRDKAQQVRNSIQCQH